MEIFLQHLLKGASLGGIYGLSALGLVIIFKSSNVLNFAHGGFLAIGAFLFLVLASWADLPIILALVLTLAGSFGLGFLFERLFRRPLTGKGLTNAIILTIGIGVMLNGILLFIFGEKTYYYPAFLSKDLLVKRGITGLLTPYASIFIIAIIFFILFGFFFRRSSQGLYIRAVSDNRPAARSLGLRVRKIFALSCAISAFVAAMSGILAGIINGANVCDLSSMGLKIFSVAILGGLYSIGGAVLGGFIIGLLETFIQGFISSSLGGMVPFIVLLIVLMVRSYGLLGRAET